MPSVCFYTTTPAGARRNKVDIVPLPMLCSGCRRLCSRHTRALCSNCHRSKYIWRDACCGSVRALYQARLGRRCPKTRCDWNQSRSRGFVLRLKSASEYRTVLVPLPYWWSRPCVLRVRRALVVLSLARFVRNRPRPSDRLPYVDVYKVVVGPVLVVKSVPGFVLVVLHHRVLDTELLLYLSTLLCTCSNSNT